MLLGQHRLKIQSPPTSVPLAYSPVMECGACTLHTLWDSI